MLIVDDEPLIRSGIRNGLGAMPGIEIVGECDCGGEAVRPLSSETVDLVLLEIQMPDCTGLDVVERIGPSRMPPVIFVTAYDEYAVKAFELHALDYLLKPFEDSRLRQSVREPGPWWRRAASQISRRRFSRYSMPGSANGSNGSS